MVQRTSTSTHRWRASLLTAALIVLARPATWALALVGFLARGGIVVLLLPIVVVPTPSGVADVVAPAVTPTYLGAGPTEPFIALLTGIVLLVSAWLVLGGLAGAWADVELVREVVADDDYPVRLPVERRHPAAAAFVVRLLSSIPLAIALTVAGVEIVSASYAELTSPVEVVTPLFVRILSDVPGAISLVVITWALCEAAGGAAVRYLLLRGESIPGALRNGWLDFIRRPVMTVTTLLVTDAGVIAALLTTVLAARVAWSSARYALLARDLVETPIAVVVLVAIWLGGLVLVGVATAWRAASWTLEVARVHGTAAQLSTLESHREVGTFGGPEHARPGG